MRKLFIAIWMITVGSILTGCIGTIDLNRAITGIECSTNEMCLADLNIPQPSNPDIVFYIEPFPFEVAQHGGYGQRVVMTAMRSGDASLCIANSLRKEFKHAAVYINGRSPKDGILINTEDVYFGANLKYSQFCKIRASLITGDTKYHIEGFGAKGALRTTDDLFVYTQACDELARNIKKILAKGKAE